MAELPIISLKKVANLSVWLTAVCMFVSIGKYFQINETLAGPRVTESIVNEVSHPFFLTTWVMLSAFLLSLVSYFLRQHLITLIVGVIFIGWYIFYLNWFSK